MIQHLPFSPQLGTLVSRSSLKVVRIRWVEVLTVLQALNVVLWTMNDYVSSTMRVDNSEKCVIFQYVLIIIAKAAPYRPPTASVRLIETDITETILGLSSTIIFQCILT